MRIAYLCGDRGVDVAGNEGSSVHVRGLVSAFTTRGHDVSVFAFGRTLTTAAAHLPAAFFPIDRDPVLEDIRSGHAKLLRERDVDAAEAFEVHNIAVNQTALYELEARGPFDMVYERHSLWSYAGAQYAERYGIPLLLEVNAPLRSQQRSFRRLSLGDAAEAIERRVLTAARWVLLTSEGLFPYVRDAGLSRRKVRVVPCGVDARDMVAQVASTREAADPFVVGFVGSLKPWHGLDILMPAFDQLRRHDERSKLLIVGDGPARRDLESYIASYRIEDRVEFTGEIPHSRVLDQLARMHTGVASYPPTKDFYFSPLKLWEYAAAGVPIAASAVGRIPELLPHKKAALLHKAGNATKLAEHLARFRDRPEYAFRLARQARRIVRDFTWDRIAARIEKLGHDAGA